MDGDIIRSRQLGNAGNYPAIDVLQSVSRLASKLVSPDEKTAARKVRDGGAPIGTGADRIPASVRSYQQIVPKTVDWRALGVD